MCQVDFAALLRVAERATAESAVIKRTPMTKKANPDILRVEFNQLEVNHIVALFDAAIRAGGLDAAKLAIPLIQKMEAAAGPPPPRT